MRRRFLCVCERGNTRSVTLAYILKDRHNQDALACGASANDYETLHLLCCWAEIILVTDDRLLGRIPGEFQPKVVDLSVGPDRWGQPLHPELQTILTAKLAEVGLP